ncbi:unnamed protein product [Blepharisma stoltei]|uniref:RRM domain-containing protein n=1 Tax=Blepharisma stoltei TaxID=1481888 RepID=A0AAU9I8U0_9CILI|nr:unnamed protein product [Blepharisma stoltei]
MNLTDQEIDSLFKPKAVQKDVVWEPDYYIELHGIKFRDIATMPSYRKQDSLITKISPLQSPATKSDSDGDTLPIPKGDSPYALAKRVEYVDKDLNKAKELYQKAIDTGHRTESAIKDLASILHQEKRTKEACELLMKYSHVFTDQAKFKNLYENLNRQIIPSGNCLNQSLRLSPLNSHDNEATVKKLFKNPRRILSIKIKTDHSKVKFAIIDFASHSAARKTLESFHRWERYRIDWLSVTGEIAAPVIHPYHKRPDTGINNKKSAENTPLASPLERARKDKDHTFAEQLLGKDLFSVL